MAEVKKSQTYAELQTQLDGYIEKLQGDSLDVDQAVELYEKASVCIGKLKAHLKKVELKISHVNKMRKP